MKYLVILFFLLALLSAPAYAQDYRKHKVEKSETVVSIAKHYKITPHDIYRLNPDSKNGIKEGTTLLIPSEVKTTFAPQKEQPTKMANTTHKVKPKETLYSLSKKYNVAVEDIKKANGNTLDGGLQTGQEIIIPVKGSGVAAQANALKKGEDKNIPSSYFYHTVTAGETKYSIAKEYGMSLQLLEELNPEVKDNLPLGYKLKLDKNAVVEKETKPVVPSLQQEAYITYEVQPKETFYSLSKKIGLTEAQIVALNPEAKYGLKDGMVLRLPKGANAVQGAITPHTVTVASNSPVAGLASTIRKNNPKELALLLPFNMARVESDTVRSQLLRTDKFLNMTLDFYAGALMAIDSAKVLGLPLKVRIMDSKESKTGSDINNIAGSLSGSNAVIGPFFQSNAEKAASLLESKGIPVISPLSKELGKSYSNLYQSMPSNDMLKRALLSYIISKNGNIVAVIDIKKGSAKDFIKANCPSARLAPLNADGTVNEAALKAQLVKDKMNYVILETERTGMVLTTIRILTAAQPEYQIQLAVTEINDALENDEVPLAKLTALKMLYPSVTNDADTEDELLFSRLYKEKNGAVPNQYATRGFDITFDTILRMFQEEGFTGAVTKVSEQIENKFAYTAQNNTGAYILYYDEDLSIKQAQ